MDISYIINVLGEELGEDVNPVSPPIYQTSNFYFKSVEQFRDAITHEKDHWIYSRGNNPTINLLTKKMAALEGAEDALVFASGMAAISSSIMANVRTGDHVICVSDPYSWTETLLTRNILPKFGVEVSMINGDNIDEYKTCIRPNTRLIYLESPNSWTFRLQDLEAVAKLAKDNNIITIIDNSCSTPLFQQPISMGIDLVCHTASKYLGGHSDTVAGVCCGSGEMIDKIFHNEFLTLGGILSPFNAWLIIRGLRTLPLRLERISNTTKEVIKYLENQPAVSEIYYASHPNHPQQELASSQMKMGSGLFTIKTRVTDIAKIEAFCNSLTYWRMAVSWGGYESLIIPSCTFVRPGLYSKLPPNLIRFSVGLEDPAVLINDLDKSMHYL